jgi:hypothetical protein
MWSTLHADLWIKSKGAFAAAKATVDTFTSRRFADLATQDSLIPAAPAAPGSTNPASPAPNGATGAAFAAAAASVAAAEGPVVSWLRRAGFTSGPLLTLGQVIFTALVIKRRGLGRVLLAYVLLL